MNKIHFSSIAIIIATENVTFWIGNFPGKVLTLDYYTSSILHFYEHSADQTTFSIEVDKEAKHVKNNIAASLELDSTQTDG